jgi:hypothetical protein
LLYCAYGYCCIGKTMHHSLNIRKMAGIETQITESVHVCVCVCARARACVSCKLWLAQLFYFCTPEHQGREVSFLFLFLGKLYGTLRLLTRETNSFSFSVEVRKFAGCRTVHGIILLFQVKFYVLDWYQPHQILSI